MSVCWACDQRATRALVQKCCRHKRPLCGKHATSMRNTMKLLARTVSASDALVCPECRTDITEASNVAEVERL